MIFNIIFYCILLLNLSSRNEAQYMSSRQKKDEETRIKTRCRIIIHLIKKINNISITFKQVFFELHLRMKYCSTDVPWKIIAKSDSKRHQLGISFSHSQKPHI